MRIYAGDLGLLSVKICGFLLKEIKGEISFYYKVLI